MTSIHCSSISSILIVDDDEVLRLILRQFLEGEHYKVVEAKNGAEALEKSSNDDYDLIIMDIAMPGIDGPAVCEQIISMLDNPPPVLMITALNDEESVDRTFQSGAVDLIRKPIQWPVLKNRIAYIIAAHRARLEIELLSRNYEMILESAANGICGVDKDHHISFVNAAALNMLGFTREEVEGRNFRDIFKVSMTGTDNFEVDCCPFLQDSPEMSAFHFDELRLQRKDGSSFSVDCRATPILEGKKVAGGVLVFQDVTERQQAAELIRYMANHDSLTDLPNRNYFNDRLPQAISLAQRHERLLCLLFIDLDRFKPINDNYGHSVGDLVLLQVAERLKQMLRTSDSVCRLGGDEFVILLESTKSISGAEYVAQKTIELLNEPIEADGHLCSIGASIGISTYPLDCNDAQTMLRHADIAMYQAKKKGRNRYELYADGTVHNGSRFSSS